MKIINASQYPDGTVLRLIRYAFAGIPAQKVGIFVRNYQGSAGRGYAYNGVPERRKAKFRSCPYLLSDDITRYVSLEMGGPQQFPNSNLMSRPTAIRQVPLTEDVLFDEQCQPRSGRDAVAYLCGLLGEHERVHAIDRRGRYATIATYTYGPYGGQGSVTIRYEDWQEGIIAYAAHEARHIWQFDQRDRERVRLGQVRTRLSEADAERYALHVLTCFRRDRRDVLSGALVPAFSFPTAYGEMYTVTRLLAPRA